MRPQANDYQKILDKTSNPAVTQADLDELGLVIDEDNMLRWNTDVENGPIEGVPMVRFSSR